MAKFFRNKCDNCGCYSIFLYLQDKKDIILKCTHCGHKIIFEQAEKKKIETSIHQIEKFLKIIELHFPDLKYLTKYGDFVKPPFKVLHNGIDNPFELNFFNELFSFEFN